MYAACKRACDCAKESTGHGSPLPGLLHGGPGRAGGGEELGGLRGVFHYMQRTALQGSLARLSMLTGNLTGRVRDQADRATARARTTAALFAATRDLSASAGDESVRRRLVHHLAELARGQAVVLQGTSRISAPEVLFLPTEVEAQVAALEAVGPGAELRSQEVGNWTLRPLYADHLALGLACWRPAPGIPLRADQQLMLEILADTGAAAIARPRPSDAAGHPDSSERPA